MGNSLEQFPVALSRIRQFSVRILSRLRLACPCCGSLFAGNWVGWVRKSHQEKGGRRACLRTGCFMESLWRRRPGAGSRGPRWVRPWFLMLWGCLQFCVLGASVLSLIFSGAPLLLPTLLCAGLGLLYFLCRDVGFRHVYWFGLCSTVIAAGVTRGRISRGEGVQFLRCRRRPGSGAAPRIQSGPRSCWGRHSEIQSGPRSGGGRSGTTNATGKKKS